MIYPYDLQAQIDAGDVINLAPGVHRAGALTLHENTRMIGQPGAVLECEGITASPTTGAYANVTIENLEIRNAGAGAIGLKLMNCQSNLRRVTLRGFTAEGLHIEGGINSRFEDVISANVPTGLRVTGNLSTSLTFSGCRFDDCINIGAIIEAACNSIVFDDWCIFESSKRGLVIDAAQVVTLINPYFENIEQDLLSVGTSSEVQSFTMINPLAVGGAANDTTKDMFVFDRVNMLTWSGGGDCRIPKASWIKTTANCKSGVVSEPRQLGIPAVYGDGGKVSTFQRNGRIKVDTLQMQAWKLKAGYTFAPGDFSLVDGTNDTFFALYAAPGTNSLRLGAKYEGGSLKGGIEANNAGFIMRSPDGSRWQCSITDAGEITRVKL